MNFVHNLVQKISPRLSRKNTAVVLTSLMVLTAAGLIFPNQDRKVRAEDVICSNGPTDNRPHLNTFPVHSVNNNAPVQNSDGTYTCYDFPFMAARKNTGTFVTGSVNNVASGDVIQVRLYVHNSAPANGPASSTANNVKITTGFNGNNGNITASANADNLPAEDSKPSGSFHVNLAPGQRLQLIDNSGVIQHYNGDFGRSDFQIGNNTLTLFPTLEGCFEKSKFVYYKFQVVQDGGNLQITKEVRNVTRNGSFADQTSATANDSLEYRIRVSAQTNTVNAVTVTDPGVSGITMTAGTLRLNNQTLSGDIRNGVSVGNVTTSSPAVITYSARLTTTQCNATLVNTARASATGVTTVQDSATVTTQCGPTEEAPICIPDTQTRDINETAFFNATGGNGTFTWSAPGGSRTSGTGSSFDTSYSTSGTKTVTVTSNGRSDTCTVIIRAVQVENPICIPDTQTRDINETAFFNATGGNGTFTWSAPGSSNTTGSGASFQTSYSTSGTKLVTLTSNGRTDTCTVIIRPAIDNTVVCVPATQTRNINQSANFSATGGNGTFTWSAPGGSRTSGTGSSFDTSYSTIGTKIVTVTSNGRTDTCTVIVQNDFQPVVCVPDFQTVNIDQRVDFTATGGNGTFVWSAPGGNPSTGSTAAFNTRYSTSGLKTVTVTSGGFTDICSVQVRSIIISGTPRLDIIKNVRNISQDIGFRNTVNARDNDHVQFEVIVKNVGTETAEDVVVRDTFPNDLELDEDSVRVDGRSYDINSDSSFTVNLGDLEEGEDVRIVFDARVNTDDRETIRNLARASADNASSVEDDAFVKTTEREDNDEPNLELSKKVRNDRTGIEGTSVKAERDDTLTYTLTVRNTGNATSQNFVIKDDLSGILAFADIVDLGGGKLNGKILSFPSEDISAGETVRKTFRVRVKYHLSTTQSFVLQNTYGNLVVVDVPGKTGFIAPKTGSSGVSATVFAGLLTSGFVAFRKRRQLQNLIFA